LNATILSKVPLIDYTHRLLNKRVGLIAAGLCIGFLLVVMYNVIFSDTVPRGVPEALRKTKQHPMLMETVDEPAVDPSASGGGGGGGGGGNNADTSHSISHQQKTRPMSDSFNALALDIIDTLDCKKLLSETQNALKDGGGWGDNNNQNNGMALDDDVTRGEQAQRRRLDEIAQQHGDDGGFGNEGGGAADAEDVGDAGDDVPEEKWGDAAAAKVGGALGGGGGGGGGGGNMRDDVPQMDDITGVGVGGGGGGWVDLSAKHLFCLAASENPPAEVQKEFLCDAAGRKRKALLELWSAARAQMQDSVFLKVLDLAREHPSKELLGRTYNIWAPNLDDGLSFMIDSLNSEKDVDNGGLHGLDEALGPGKMFVDVGSCLGMTCLAINSKYPGTKIVSLEPAAPNWLLQELNLRCNLDHDEFKNFHVVLAGVGPNTEDEDNMMAKLMWRPTATTSTRAWTPADEHKSDDIELVVRLRRLKSILAEADVFGDDIDVMNVDCEGCEYNLIPALTEEEFDAIPTVMGGVHWGYIPTNKLPSSARGKTTHERLCSHENIARVTKECCAFPDLAVKSSVPGEVLVKEDKGFPPRESTVTDVINDGLCDDFSTWAADHFLHDVQDDWGWFELTSQA
jgi:FkbM family methyltransferase